MKEPNLRASDEVQASMKSRLYWGIEVDIVGGDWVFVCLAVLVVVIADFLNLFSEEGQLRRGALWGFDS